MVVLLFVLLLAAAGLQKLAVWLALRFAGLGSFSLVVSFGVIVLLDMVIGAGVTSLGACADAAVFTAFYRQRRRELGGAVVVPVLEGDRVSRLGMPGWAKGLVAVMVLAMLVAAGISVALAVSALGHEGPITVTAHRGGHKRAPENTAAAFREAIAT